MKEKISKMIHRLGCLISGLTWLVCSILSLGVFGSTLLAFMADLKNGSSFKSLVWGNLMYFGESIIYVIAVGFLGLVVASVILLISDSLSE